MTKHYRQFSLGGQNNYFYCMALPALQKYSVKKHTLSTKIKMTQEGSKILNVLSNKSKSLKHSILILIYHSKLNYHDSENANYEI